MEDDWNVGMGREDSRYCFVGLPRVDYCRLPEFGRKAELGLEGPVLIGSWGMIVMEIETGLSHRHDTRVGQPLPKPRFSVRSPPEGIVRMYTGRGQDSLIGGGQRERGIRSRTRLPDHHDASHACRPGPFERFGPIRRERGVREMAMGVD
jgi:hypothetical protein